MVRLPEVEPAIFKIYVNWVYTSLIDLEVVILPRTQECLDKHKHADPTESSSDWCRKSTRVHAYSALYGVADMLLDTRIKICIIDCLMASEREDNFRMSSSTLRYIWTKALSGCGLQRMLLDTWTSKMPLDAAKKIWTSYPLQLKTDLAMRLLEMRGKRQDECDPINAPRCHYHDHEDGASCD